MARRIHTGLAACGLLALAAALPQAQEGPAAGATGMPADVLALACAPTLVDEPPAAVLRITGGQDSFVRRMYAPGDLVTINAGARDGVEVGQEFFTRRVTPMRREPLTRDTPAPRRTSGWIRIYAVDERQSLATITHACASIEVGDYLEPLVFPLPPAAAAAAPPQRENYGRVLVGQDGRRSFGRGDFLIVDRGSDHGVVPGAGFVFYRDKRQPDNFLFELGAAVAVDVTPASSTLRVTASLDAIAEGDYAALRR